MTDRFKDLDSEFGMYTRGYPWQKFAAIKKAFSETEAEWVLWVSSDTLFVNMDFEIESLIEAHPGRNLIVFEPKEPINGCIYEDSGIFLIRNSEFSLNFLMLKLLSHDLLKMGSLNC